ncbi:MAG: glycoside hydrolase family 15 protein [Thermaerobacter sp.]|nr:glycoside hydrolase family 15 protein [Thermaerobacter sp.]
MKQFYGFISNGQTAALISPHGSIDWLPLPHFDSDAVFSRMLDAEVGGHFSLRPETAFRADQSYVPGTNVLETRLRTPSGTATITDYLVIGRAELRRLVRSEVPLIVECRPRFRYGQSLAAQEARPDGAVYRDPQDTGAVLLFLRGARAGLIDRERWLLPPGDHELVLRHTPDLEKEQQELLELGDDPEDTLRDAVHFWRSAPLPSVPGPLGAAFERSVLTMRGLTSRASGAVLAAPSTSLPEQVGGSRNWDYRFVWVRDASYAAEAFLLVGDVSATRRLIEFLLGAVQMTGKPFLSPFMRIDGTFSLGERELRWLSGHRGSRPVRVGNAASAQLQLDVEGDLLWAIWRYVRESEDIDFVREKWWAIERLVAWSSANWHRPDASLWEFRGAPQRYTHSLVLCWVAIQTGSRLAHLVGREDAARRWAAEADQVAAEVFSQCYDEELGRFVQGVDLPDVDAALLCMPLYGFIDPGDPRWLRTLQDIEEHLVEDGLVYRYRVDEMGRARHPFTLGSTWLARTYLRSGDIPRATAILERLVASATPLLLWGEHVDPQEGEQRGNFPQLFPHAGFAAAVAELRSGAAMPRLQDLDPPQVTSS